MGYEAILLNLIAQSPDASGKWFAAAKDAGLEFFADQIATLPRILGVADLAAVEGRNRAPMRGCDLDVATEIKGFFWRRPRHTLNGCQDRAR